MRKIFISYRRSEAEYIAGSLARDLRRHFGEEQIFRDKEDVEGGISWRKKVLDEIDRNVAVLILFSKEWVNVRDENGQRRIDNPDDPLRLEIADAIKDSAKIIPILLENAQMPSAQELPEELRPIAEINALKLRDAEWQFDLDRICKTLEAIGFHPVATPQPAPGPHPAPTPRGKWNIKAVTALGLALLTLVMLASEEESRDAYIGAALISIIPLVLGILAFKDTASDGRKGRGLAVSAIVVAVVTLLAALGNLGTTDTSSPPVNDSTTTVQPPPLPEFSSTTGETASTDTLPPEPEQPPPPPPAITNIAGNWFDVNGVPVMTIQQEGQNLYLNIATVGGTAEGYGTLMNSNIEADITLLNFPFGHLSLILSPNAAMLTGTLQLTNGMVMQMMYRR